MYSRKQVDSLIRKAWVESSRFGELKDSINGLEKFVRTNLPVKVVIEAKVECFVHLEEGEFEHNLKERLVDIYLHGNNRDGDGHHNKEDRGCDFSTITIVE